MSTNSYINLTKAILTAVRSSHLPLYSCKYSRKTYTQHQLMAILLLREALGTDYRDTVRVKALHALCNPDRTTPTGDGSPHGWKKGFAVEGYASRSGYLRRDVFSSINRCSVPDHHHGHGFSRNMRSARIREVTGDALVQGDLTDTLREISGRSR